MPNQQMKLDTLRYPFDRYLVESNKKMDMVNIIDEEIWASEPALKPEDEIVLKKLHDMLQSTAHDLKLLSGELSRYHQPKIQIKKSPVPLDEEFNEKVHIEEIVNAKFHGYKMVDKLAPDSPLILDYVSKSNGTKSVNTSGLTSTTSKSIFNKNPEPIVKKTVKNLGFSRTKKIEIDGNYTKKVVDNESKNKMNVTGNIPSVAYNEFSFKYVEPKAVASLSKPCQVQVMPSINIRSDLKEQKVLQLDIPPECCNTEENKSINNAFVIMCHEQPIKTPHYVTSDPINNINIVNTSSKSNRKVSKMISYDSSGSTNNNSSDSYKNIASNIELTRKMSPKTTLTNFKKVSISKKSVNKPTSSCIDEWEKKLEEVYGKRRNSKNTILKSKSSLSKSLRQTQYTQNSALNKLNSKPLNNAEYIPYSQLTLGGVTVSDIEKEIAELPDKNNVPLSPILDKILSSRENSFYNVSPKKCKQRNNILSQSDENLLQEVIDIEKQVSETLSNKLVKENDMLSPLSKNFSSNSNNASSKQSYTDDFDEDKDHLENNDKVSRSASESINSAKIDGCDDHNLSYVKSSNLSYKNKVDIFEFIPSVNRQDIAIQSQTISKVNTIKETQTTPRNENSNMKSINNDLRCTNLKDEIENLFKLEKDFIKKIIIDEYGDLLQKNISKPSFSKHNGDLHIGGSDKNVAVYPKVTQTSPKHVKSVMTSPAQMKTRGTSPFHATLRAENHISPTIFVTNENELKSQVQLNEKDNVRGICINLSSPRFSLKLSQHSRSLSQSDVNPSSLIDKKDTKVCESKAFTKNIAVSSSSTDADNNSSETSSLGEVRTNKRILRRIKTSSISELSSSSTFSKDSNDGILPLRSEGEMSSELFVSRSRSIKKSDGEISFGQLR